MGNVNYDTNLSKKVGGYVRVSTFEQAEKGTSLDEQKRIIREECSKRGWQLMQIYCDEGASGKLTDRQGLSDLQRDARAGLFQTIMFTKSDRLTRSIRDLSNLWHDWTEGGLEIICVEQPEISSKGIYGKMMRNLLGIIDGGYKLPQEVLTMPTKSTARTWHDLKYQFRRCPKYRPWFLNFDISKIPT